MQLNVKFKKEAEISQTPADQITLNPAVIESIPEEIQVATMIDPVLYDVELIVNGVLTKIKVSETMLETSIQLHILNQDTERASLFQTILDQIRGNK
jgi:hypothetical protein